MRLLTEVCKTWKQMHWICCSCTARQLSLTTVLTYSKRLTILLARERSETTELASRRSKKHSRRSSFQMFAAFRSFSIFFESVRPSCFSKRPRVAKLESLLAYRSRQEC